MKKYVTVLNSFFIAFLFIVDILFYVLIKILMKILSLDTK